METNIDFSKSFVTWLTANEESYGRFNVESRVKVLDTRSGVTKCFFLLSGVMAGNIYSRSELIKYPPYLYQAIFSDHGEFRILRTFADKTDDQIGVCSELFARIDINMIHANGEFLVDNTSIKEATLSNQRLGGKLYHDESDYSIEIDFPIKHINVKPGKKALFQVETGPVLLHNKGSKSQLESLTLGYVFFSSLEQYECVLASNPGSENQRVFDVYQKRKSDIKIITYHGF